MKLFRIFAIAAMAMLSNVGAQAGMVLYSNMGANGLTDTSIGDATTIASSALLASGFTTGSVQHALRSVSLVIDSPVASNHTVSIYLDNNGSPGTLLRTSGSVFVATSPRGVYTFEFEPTMLTAGTTYWVRPDIGLRWFTADENLPDQENGSGYTFFAAQQSTNGGSSWSDLADGSFTLSLTVPEPALSSLLCFGGIALIRRRRNK